MSFDSSSVHVFVSWGSRQAEDLGFGGKMFFDFNQRGRRFRLGVLEGSGMS